MVRTHPHSYTLAGAPEDFFINSVTGIVLGQFAVADAGKTFAIQVILTDAAGAQAVRALPYSASLHTQCGASNGSTYHTLGYSAYSV